MAIEGASLTPIYNRLNSVGGYHPMNVDSFADWSVEAGDIVSVSRDGTAYASPVHSTRLVWRGSPEMQINATGKEKRDNIAKVSRRKYGRGGAGMRNNQGLYYEMFSEDGHLHSSLEYTESRLHTEFEDADAQLRSEFEITASHLRTEFIDADEQLRGEFEVTASHLRTEFEDADAHLRSEFEVTASHLRTEFEDADAQLQSEFEVTASRMRTEYSDGIAGVHSEVEQTARSWSAKISGVADEDGNVSAASIAVAINASSGESEARLDAQKVYIGNTKSTTVIAGKATLSDVTADYIQSQIASLTRLTMLSGYAGSFYVNNGNGQSQNIDAAIWDIQLVPSGNTYTLKRKRIGDSDYVDIGSFSRATTLSGAWDSGTLTVSASPQGNTFVRTIRQDTAGETWGPGYVVVPIYAEYTSGGTTYTESTGRNVYVFFDDTKLQNKTVTANGVITADEGYLGLKEVTVQVPSSTTVPVISYAWSQSGQLTVSTTPAAQEDLVRRFHKGSESWNGNVVTVPIIATWGSQDQYSEDTNIPVTVDASARYTAGQNSVTVSKSYDRTNSRVVFSKSAGTASTKAVMIGVAGSWNENIYTYNIKDYEDNQEGVNIENNVRTVDATARYTAGESAGKAAVTLNNPTWQYNATQAESHTTNTVTVSTNGRPTQLSKSVPVTIAQGTWNGNTKTVDITTTNGVLVARDTVNATVRYDAGVTAGKNAITLTDSGWSSGKVTFGKSEGTASTKTVQLVASSASWSGNTATVQIWDGTAADTQHGRNTGYTVTVNASGRYNAGVTDGKNAVTINKGSWSGGQISFTKSEGTASTKTVQLAAANATWDGKTATVKIWDGTAADSQHGVDTGYTVTVNANFSMDYNTSNRYVELYNPEGEWSGIIGYYIGDLLDAEKAAGQSAGETTGRNSVRIVKSSWDGGVVTFSKSAGTSDTKEVRLSQPTLATWSGATATKYVWDGTAADAQHGVNTGYPVTITASFTQQYNPNSRYVDMLNPDGDWTHITGYYIGDLLDAENAAGVASGRTAGQNAVTINKSYNNSQSRVVFSKSVGTASTKAVKIGVKDSGSGFGWSGNTYTYRICDYEDNEQGVNLETNARTVDATARYNAGVTDGENGVVLGYSPNSRYVDVYRHDGTTWTGQYGYYIGNLLDAENAAGQSAGRNSVRIVKSSWDGGVVTFSKSAGTSDTKEVRLSQPTLATWSGATATKYVWDGTAADAQHGVNTGYPVTITASFTQQYNPNSRYVDMLNPDGNWTGITGYYIGNLLDAEYTRGYNDGGGGGGSVSISIDNSQAYQDGSGNPPWGSSGVTDLNTLSTAVKNYKNQTGIYFTFKVSAGGKTKWYRFTAI